MYREVIIFFGILVICLFMTVHNSNLSVIKERTTLSQKQKVTQENYLINEGLLIKLSNGVVLRKSSDIIIIEQASKSIIINRNDASQIIAFLESN